MKRVAISTLGCKVNTYESELIMQRLSEQNYTRVDSSEAADIYVINSCTVTAEADRQSRQLARKLKRQNANATVIMTGCYAQNNPEKVAELDAVDWVVGNAAKLDIPNIIAEKTQAEYESQSNIVIPEFDEQKIDPLAILGGYESQSRAFIQIQQGCDQGCTFCIIHVARGPNTSFSAEQVTAQFKKMVDEGYKEVVLCGVDLGAYGEDAAGDINLYLLLKSLLALRLDCRIRLSSIDPYHLSEELIDLMGQSNQICSQVHLSMQSASTLILKRMKRRASRQMIFDKVARLREAMPNLVLSADVLVGFPTETEAHFAETLSAIESLVIAYPHVFPYSKREGTPAARIPNQVDRTEIKRRARLVRELGRQVWERQAQNRLFSTQRAIVEVKGDKYDLVRCDDYFPVKLPALRELADKGQWCKIKITGIDEQSLLGERIISA